MSSVHFLWGPRMKTNSQRDGNMWEENGTKSRRESKLLEIFCFRQNIGPREGRGDGNYSWELILDMWHVIFTGHEPRPRLLRVWSLSSPGWRRMNWEPVIKTEKKYKTWSESDMFLYPWWNVTLMMNEARVFILHNIKVCCWYLVSKREILYKGNLDDWLDDLSLVKPLLLKFGEIVPK